MRAGWLTSGVLMGLMLGHSFAQQTSPMIDAPSYTRAQLSAQNTGPDKWQREAPPAEGIAAPTSNFPRRYQPLSGPQKFNIFLKTTYSPGTFVSAAFDAGLMQAQGDLGGYGGGMEGYGKRYGAALADSEAGVFFGKFLLPWMLHQDPRYFRRAEGATKERALYAMSRVFVTRNDDGSSGFNFSHTIGRLLGKTLANAYYPPQNRGTGATFRRTGNALLDDMGDNLLREFWPDIRERLLRHRSTARMENIAERVQNPRFHH